jgi:hypothetical protein
MLLLRKEMHPEQDTPLVFSNRSLKNMIESSAPINYHETKSGSPHPPVEILKPALEGHGHQFHPSSLLKSSKLNILPHELDPGVSDLSGDQPKKWMATSDLSEHTPLPTLSNISKPDSDQIPSSPLTPKDALHSDLGGKLL